jgi:hypothetical protein
VTGVHATIVGGNGSGAVEGRFIKVRATGVFVIVSASF